MAKRQIFGGAGRALSHRYYRRYWLGLLVATIGIWAYRVAMGWLVWELTKSPIWLGLIAVTEMVPIIIVGPIAGAYVDRKGSLQVGRIAQAAWALSVVLLAAVTLGDMVSKEILLVFAALQGLVNGLANPAHLALVAKLVPARDLSPAIALQSGSVQSGRFIGPALAGLILVNFGPGMVFALVAVGLIFFSAVLYTLKTIGPEKLSDSAKSLAGDFADGIRYVLGDFPIRTIIIYTAFTAVLLRPVVELMPGIADVVFDRGADGLAWLLTTFGIGSLLSAFWIAVRGKTEGLTRVFSANLLLGAFALFAFATTSNFWLAMLLVTIIGFCSTAVSVCCQTLAQHLVEGHMRARVMGLVGVTFRAVPALGTLVQGWGSSLFGFGPSIAAAAGLCLIVWLAFTRLIKRHHQLSEMDR